jgi:hypothetical protein
MMLWLERCKKVEQHSIICGLEAKGSARVQAKFNSNQTTCVSSADTSNDLISIIEGCFLQ